MATQEYVKRYIQRYLREANRHIEVKKAILFGSHVRGVQRKNSDIDLAIISDDFTDNPIENRRMLSPLSFRFHRIEFHPFNYTYFRKGDPFVDEIKKTGIVIPIEN